MKHFNLVGAKQQSTTNSGSSGGVKGTTIINNITNVTNINGVEKSNENYKGKITVSDLLALDTSLVGANDLYLVYSSYSSSTGWSKGGYFTLNGSFSSPHAAAGVDTIYRPAVTNAQYKIVVTGVASSITLGIYPSDSQGTPTGADYFGQSVTNGTYYFTPTLASEYISVITTGAAHVLFCEPVADGTFVQWAETADVDSNGVLSSVTRWIPVNESASLLESPALFNPLPNTLHLLTGLNTSTISTPLYGQSKSGIKIADITTYGLNNDNVYESQTFSQDGQHPGQTDTRSIVVPYARSYESGGTMVYEGGALSATDYENLKDISANYVTTNTSQAITGFKTFAGAVYTAAFSSVGSWSNNSFVQFQNNATAIGNIGVVGTSATDGKPAFKNGANSATYFLVRSTWQTAVGDANTPVYIDATGVAQSTGKHFSDYALTSSVPTTISQLRDDTFPQVSTYVSDSGGKYVTICKFSRTPSQWAEWEFSLRVRTNHSGSKGDVTVRVAGTDLNSSVMGTPSMWLSSRPVDNTNLALTALKFRIYKLSDTEYALAFYKANQYVMAFSKLEYVAGVTYTKVLNGTMYSESDAYVTQAYAAPVARYTTYDTAVGSPDAPVYLDANGVIQSTGKSLNDYHSVRGGTWLSGRSDFNTITDPGCYMSNSDSNSVNKPTGANPYGILNVIRSVKGETWSYIRQEYLDSQNSKLYYRYSVSNGSSWTSWYEVAKTSDIPTKLSQLSNDSSWYATLGTYGAEAMWQTVCTFTHTPTLHHEWGFNIEICCEHNASRGSSIVRICGTDGGPYTLATPKVFYASRPTESKYTTLVRVYQVSAFVFAVAVYRQSVYENIRCITSNVYGTTITHVSNGTQYATADTYLTGTERYDLKSDRTITCGANEVLQISDLCYTNRLTLLTDQQQANVNMPSGVDSSYAGLVVDVVALPPNASSKFVIKFATNDELYTTTGRVATFRAIYTGTRWVRLNYAETAL